MIVDSEGGSSKIDSWRAAMFASVDVGVSPTMVTARRYGQMARVPNGSRQEHQPDRVTKKPSFRNSATKRRAIIPANGYYEWMKSEEGKKIPYFLHGDGDVIAMAELYELWPDPELPEDDPSKWVWTCTILTRPATDATGHIHDRSPLILPESFWEHWRGPNLTDKGEVQAMINSVPEPHLEPFEVSTAVNSPRNNTADLLNPV